MGTLKRMIRRRLMRLVTSVYDPLVDLSIGDQRIKVPLSHSLKENMEVHPHINQNLGRLVRYAAQFYPGIKVIDIGANVGDSVAFIKNYIDAPVLCIDGDDRFFKILEQNMTQYKNVSVCHSLVGAESGTVSLELKTRGGTAYLVDSGNSKQISSLEDILERFPAFSDSKLLKIDTDGFDTTILKGSRNYLTKCQPVLFFEFDPFLTKQNNDDPFTLFSYLKSCGYKHLVFYMSNGDYLLSCDIDNTELTSQLVHYFSGRNVELYTDVCVFPEGDKALFEKCVEEEMAYFRAARKY